MSSHLEHDTASPTSEIMRFAIVRPLIHVFADEAPQAIDVDNPIWDLMDQVKRKPRQGDFLPRVVMIGFKQATEITHFSGNSDMLEEAVKQTDSRSMTGPIGRAIFGKSNVRRGVERHPVRLTLSQGFRHELSRECDVLSFRLGKKPRETYPLFLDVAHVSSKSAADELTHRYNQTVDPLQSSICETRVRLGRLSVINAENEIVYPPLLQSR